MEVTYQCFQVLVKYCDPLNIDIWAFLNLFDSITCKLLRLVKRVDPHVQVFIHLSYLTITFVYPRVEFINHSWVARLTLFLLQDKELNHFDSLVDVVVQSLLDLVDVVLVILLLNHSWLHNFIDQLLALRFQVKPLHLVWDHRCLWVLIAAIGILGSLAHLAFNLVKFVWNVASEALHGRWHLTACTGGVHSITVLQLRLWHLIYY